MMNQFKGEKGFTLIELMIVIVVIGILATVALPQLSKVRNKARVSTVQSEFNSIKTVMEMYYVDHQAYPGDLDALDPDYTTSAVLQDANNDYYDDPNGTNTHGNLDTTTTSGAYKLEYDIDDTDSTIPQVELNSSTGQVTLN